MIVGLLSVDLALFESHSLKDKRRVIQSVKQRVRNGFNVSVAEIGSHDLHQRCQLGFAMVGAESRPVHAQFDKLVELLRRVRGATLLDYEREFV